VGAGGGFANGMRDLLAVLGIERATVVGHSLGGGVALQLAYQYPEMCERLVLIASGGLGSEVTPLLRAIAVPGTGALLAASARAPVRLPVLAAARAAAAVGLLDGHDVDGLDRVWSGLRQASTRTAFLRTLRSVVDLRGQTVSGRDRLYLTAEIPTLLVWGGRDPVLPVAHARAVAAALAACRLEVVSGAGHMPHRSHAGRVHGAVQRFVDETQPAVHDTAVWRALLAADATASTAP
jgi:pimeloyl-ACP methyl ester carboxylesterase